MLSTKNQAGLNRISQNVPFLSLPKTSPVCGKIDTEKVGLEKDKVRRPHLAAYCLSKKAGEILTPAVREF
jgi:hypothetical protein